MKLANFKDTYSNWKPKFEQAIKNELEDKELIQIIQDGITIEATYSFKLVYTKNPTSFNKDQDTGIVRIEYIEEIKIWRCENL